MWEKDIYFQWEDKIKAKEAMNLTESRGRVHGMLWGEKKEREMVWKTKKKKSKLPLKKERENHQSIAEKQREDTGRTLYP